CYANNIYCRWRCRTSPGQLHAYLVWPESNVRNREPSVGSRNCRWVLFSGRWVYRYLRSGHRFTGSRAHDTSPGRRRRSTLLCLKRDRGHQSQQQTPAHQSEGLIKASSYCVFLCIVVFMHENFLERTRNAIEGMKDFNEPGEFLRGGV